MSTREGATRELMCNTSARTSPAALACKIARSSLGFASAASSACGEPRGEPRLALELPRDCRSQWVPFALEEGYRNGSRCDVQASKVVG